MAERKKQKPRSGPEAQNAIEAEARIPHTMHDREIARALKLGLQGADSIVDKTIPTFSRGELPHFAGINTFLKQPYIEDVRLCGNYDVAIVGAPFDSGATYRSGARFGPQGMRKISALFGSYNFELGVDLRESITMCDLGDIFTIPGNIEKTFDQMSKAIGHIYASGALPVVLGGDHSLGFPTTRGVAEHLGRRQARHHPLRPSRRYAGHRPGRADAHLSLVPRHRTFPTCRPRTSSRSASAAGSRRGPA